MLYSNDALAWVNMLFTRHITDKAAVGDKSPSHIPEVYEGALEHLDDDILGKRGLTYGRLPASEFRNVWRTLDIGNESMSELVEHFGRKEVPGEARVKMIETDEWDEKAFLEKLERIVMEREEVGS